MISHLRRTKIIATFGPSITQKLWTWEMYNDPKNAAMVKKAYEETKKALLSGVNTVRLNFSHGNYDEQGIRIKIVREVAQELKRPISIMLDTKGPEIRVVDAGEEGIVYQSGQKITLYSLKKDKGTSNSFCVTDSTQTYNMAKDLEVGNTILVDDGKLNLKVTNLDVANGIIETVAINTHLLRSNKRINLPNADYSIPFLSEKDQKDIEFAVENKLNYIAISFANSKANVLEIKEILKQKNAEHIKIVSKIETMQAIKNIDEIISVSDGIMIARGDLGLEAPFYEVPYWGKYIIKKCRYANIPVIMATQMLDSLEKNIIPTRAEASDVFWAVELGVDATMLSGESAQGLFPVNAIEVMSRLDKQSEIHFDYGRALNTYFPLTEVAKTPMGLFIKKIANRVKPERQVMNEEFEYQAIATFTNDQTFLKGLSAARCAARVLAFTTDINLYNSCGILYGITPVLVADLELAQKHYVSYVHNYFANHIQTAGKSKLTKKTLVVLNDQLIDIDKETKPLDPTFKAEFLHKSF